MEFWDVYDMNRKKTGQTIVRGQPIPKGGFHLVVHVCIIGSDGRMLVQQRQPFKCICTGTDHQFQQILTGSLQCCCICISLL